MSLEREDILASARRLFPDREISAVMQILDGYGAEPQEAVRDRVQLAILRLSEDQQAKLQHYVQAAKHDYRDVLHWSEHPAPLPGLAASGDLGRQVKDLPPGTQVRLDVRDA
jgi:hypothetical protein